MEQSSDLHALPFARQSPFDKLAISTIAHIFDSACPDVDLPTRQPGVLNEYRPRSSDVSDPWVLSTVCKRWRAITTSYYSLWTTIVIESARISRADWMLWGLSQLRDCLNRSASHPLKIRVSGTKYNDAEIILILDVLQAYSQRWKSIEFLSPLSPGLLHRFHYLDGRLPMLEHLEIHLSIPDSVDIGTLPICSAFLSAPALSRMCIVPFPGMWMLRNVQIPWTQISEVTFSRHKFYRRSDLYGILTWLSSSLTTLTFSIKLDASRDSEIWRQPERIKLAKLRRLSFFADSTGIFDMMSCSSLKELHIESGKEDEIARFLDDSSCSLTHMHIGNIVSQSSSEDFASTVFTNASLSTLQSISLTTRIDAILGYFIFDSRNLFPSLEILRVYSHLTGRVGSSEGYMHLGSQMEGLKNIMQSRTRAVPSNDPEFSMPGIEATHTRHVGRSALKSFFLTFVLATDKLQLKVFHSWEKNLIKDFRSLCIAQNIQVLLELLYLKK